MRKEWLMKFLALCVIVLFIGVSFQPIIAEETVSTKEESNYENYSFDEAKEYLFQTLVDISNNPDVKEFLIEHKRDLIRNNNDNYFKNAIQKINSQNPKLLKSVLFTKPEITVEYYETSYNRGLEIVDILGREKSSKFIEYISTFNPELFDELKDIIGNDDELYNKVLALKKISFSNNDIICMIITLLWFPVLPILFFDIAIWVLIEYLPFFPVLEKIFILTFAIFINPLIVIGEYFDCPVWWE